MPFGIATHPEHFLLDLMCLRQQTRADGHGNAVWSVKDRDRSWKYTQIFFLFNLIFMAHKGRNEEQLGRIELFLHSW
jgi:hypothetical protein